jgi:hypothetical protein
MFRAVSEVLPLSGWGSLRVLHCLVYPRPRGITPQDEARTERPSAVPDDIDSLRLWVVSQVCDEVTLSYGPGKTTVLLSMRTR